MPSSHQWLRKWAGRERQMLIIEQFWRRVPRRLQLCSFVAVSGRSRRLLQENQEALKRYRLIPSFLILDSSVCRGMPSLTAAPVGPPTTPSDSRRAASRISLSCSTRSAIRGAVVAAGLGVTCVSQVSSTKKVSPSKGFRPKEY